MRKTENRISGGSDAQPLAAGDAGGNERGLLR
jgi:hypothetical protein